MADSFVWGGKTWGPGDLDAFIAYLNAHGTDYSAWAENHLAAAAILTSNQPAPQNEPLPKSIGTALEDYIAAGSTPAEAAAAVQALVDAQNAQGITNISPSQLLQDAQDVADNLAGGSGSSSGSGSSTPATPTAPPDVQVVFSHDDLVNLWLYVGGPSAVADIAAAIALAESQGCKYAKAGPNDDRPANQCTYRYTEAEDSFGLWQVNHEAHPIYTSDELYDAVGNARAALAISSGGTDFGPWTTYTSGAFTQYLTGSPSTSSVFTALPPAQLVTATQPAGAGAAWSNVIGQYATNVPATNTKVGAIANSLINVFKG